MRIGTVLLLTTALQIIASPPLCSLQARDQRSLAVLDFDYVPIVDSKHASVTPSASFGQGFTERLLESLSSVVEYRIVERAQMLKIKTELDLAADASFDSEKRMRFGKLVPADALVYGSITYFGPEPKGFMSSIGSSFAGNRLVVRLTAKMANTETAAVFFTTDVEGKSTSKYAGKTQTFFGAEMDNTVVVEAIDDAICKLTEELRKAAPQVPKREFKLEGKVALVKGDHLTINVGSTYGVRVGDMFCVSKILQEIIDPDSKRVLDVEVEDVGRLEIIRVRDNIAEGEFTRTAGAGPVEIGFRVSGGACNVVDQ